MLYKTNLLNLSNLLRDCYLENYENNTKKYFNLLTVIKINLDDHSASEFRAMTFRTGGNFSESPRKMEGLPV